MAVAAGYFDESDDVERAYSVAGLIGLHKDFVYLDWAWRKKILGKYELEYFKASELNHGTGQFARFRDNPHDLNALFSEREKKLFMEIKIASIDVFLESDIAIGVGAVLMLPDHKRLQDEYALISKVIPAPYFLCSQLCLMESGNAMNYVNEGVPQRNLSWLRPIFDSHEEYAGRAKQVFDIFKEKNPVSSRYLLPVRYEDDTDYVVLQIADNIAYECRRLLVTLEFDKHIPERKAMIRLKDRMSAIYKLDYDTLKKLMERQTPNEIRVGPETKNPYPVTALKASLATLG